MYFVSSKTGYDIILWIRIAGDQFPTYQDFFDKDSPASTNANWIIQSWVYCHLFVRSLCLNACLSFRSSSVVLNLFYTGCKYLFPMPGSGVGNRG